MFNLYSNKNKRHETTTTATTGHDRFCRTNVSNKSSNRRIHRLNKNDNIQRSHSAKELQQSSNNSAVYRRQAFSRHRSASSEQDNSDQSEHSEKSPLVSAKFDTLAKIFFHRSITSESGSRETIESSLSRSNFKYQYTALDVGNGIQEKSPRERALREHALNVCQEWTKHSNGRYEVKAHLDDIGSRHNKNWFLINDTTVRTDRLMTLLPIPSDCVALEELPPCESPKGLLMELLGSLHHPYLYPVLDLGFIHVDSIIYACLVMPFNPRGSLKDLIYKSQWNDPWNIKYSRKPSCLPMSQVQRLGRQILEALLFLKERGFPLHGHLHSGNIIIQNGVARLSGLENGLLGLNSRNNAVAWSQTATQIENIDIICFGHLLYEMCSGYELTCPNPSIKALEKDLEKYTQITEILKLIFEPQNGCIPTVEDLVLCDIFRNIDLRELRGPSNNAIRPNLSSSTLSLLQAVKKRQTVSLRGSYTETSSPCTPPSTPHDRCIGVIDSFDLSSDSDALDEVLITSDSFTSQQYDQLGSPIHFCDNSIQSDDNSTASTSAGCSQEFHGSQNFHTTFNNQLSTDLCSYKNTKSRRLEYSLRCMKNVRSNPSQDSAFGSLTDGDQSVASSIKLNSFQSMTSPIDEGVEDIFTIDNKSKTLLQIDSVITTSNSCSISDENIKIYRSASVSPRHQINKISNSPSIIILEPPKIVVNDQHSIYTTSPSKRSGTVEVFSQKYRVCSFEDMSPRKKHLRNTKRIEFRSLEEERRIDNAFTPIKSRTSSENRVYTNNNEKYHKLTHISFSNKINNSKRDRHNMWKDSIFYRKTKIAKSDDSLLESPGFNKLSKSNQDILNTLKKGNSINEIFKSSNSKKYLECDGKLNFEKRKSRSERHLVNLSKFKLTTVNGFFSDNENSKEKSLGSIFSLQNSTKGLNLQNENLLSNDSSGELSPIHRHTCKVIGGMDESSEENTPLLESMEMSSLSPSDSEQQL